MERSELPVDDRTTHFMLGDPIGDGGQWNMAMNLIVSMDWFLRPHIPSHIAAAKRSS